MTQSILLLGAGELGIAILEALSKHPRRSQARLAVLVRRGSELSAAPEKKRTTERIRALGGHLEAADVAQAPTSELAAIFRNYDTIVSCMGMSFPPGTQSKVARAALEAGVKRFFPWQFGMDYDIIGEGSSQDLFDEQLVVRKMLRDQEGTIKWTIVSTGVFTSFLFEASFGVVDLEARTVRALGSWETRITTTTPDDIGRVTADVILDPQELGEESGVVYTASDTVSYGELADLLDAHFGSPFKRELWDKEALRKQMDDDANALVKYRDTFAQGRGVAWDKEKTVNYQRGIPMTSVKDYIESIGAKDQYVAQA